MFGYLQVGNATSPGAPEYELKQQGITHDEPLVLWEWAVDSSKSFNGTNDTNTNGCQKLNQIFYQVFLPALTISKWVSLCAGKRRSLMPVLSRFSSQTLSQLFKLLTLIHIITNSSSYLITLTVTAY
jgi:hypothetical protein